jgi:L-alanine-DL-glutamate epimerase-like enolase superfamily enzyme
MERVPIEDLTVGAYTIPTESPEADGTIAWTSTSLVVVEVKAGGRRGLGYTYAQRVAADLIQGLLAERIRGMNAFDLPAAWLAMVAAVRNAGRPGIASMAISAVDSAMWDLKAKLLDLSLLSLLGAVREAIPVYGSGGFTTYSLAHLQDQLSGWVRQGISRVKMKVGTDPDHDLLRVRAAREAIGPDCELFVDANGAYGAKQALEFARQFAEYRVRWFEEPVSSDDLEGLHLIRERAPALMDITAGEYGFDTPYFRRMLAAEAVDVLMADATRCLGITGFLQASALCDAHMIPLSAHCAPSLHATLGCALHPVRHIEYFFDHARIERMVFDGVLTPIEGKLRPDLSRPGLGIDFKRADAERLAA